MTDATPNSSSAAPVVTIRKARRRFEPGMIVLDPRPGEEGALVWTCARVSSIRTTLVADYGADQAEAVLSGPESGYVPDGWRILEHDEIARVFSGDGGPGKPKKPKPLAEVLDDGGAGPVASELELGAA